MILSTLLESGSLLSKSPLSNKNCKSAPLTSLYFVHGLGHYVESWLAPRSTQRVSLPSKCPPQQQEVQPLLPAAHMHWPPPLQQVGNGGGKYIFMALGTAKGLLFAFQVPSATMSTASANRSSQKKVAGDARSGKLGKRGTSERKEKKQQCSTHPT
ncbi:hypothetical protein JTE90_000861 [Oedothorax gibbosus]|uniref:Uncharacterized protein n=1 Tax=Oedothorax gibbosus TaxID=931172 RepID=A0AAV6VTZ3_9ARAC|nr:hypothetical protein JTE90_000861 [Oedothorax gibbosus]